MTGERTRSGRGWRIVAALGLLLASAAFLLAVLLFRTIQTERANSIRTACITTNQRNRDTLAEADRKTLERLTGRRVPPATPAAEIQRRLQLALGRLSREQRIQVAQGRDVVVTLVAKMFPVEDCDRRVRDRVSSRR